MDRARIAFALALAAAIDGDVGAVIAENADSCSTSARCGTFSSVSVSSVKSEAIISGKAAFLAPEIGMIPRSSLPPVILMRSMGYLTGAARLS